LLLYEANNIEEPCALCEGRIYVTLAMQQTVLYMILGCGHHISKVFFTTTMILKIPSISDYWTNDLYYLNLMNEPRIERVLLPSFQDLSPHRCW